MTPDIEDILTAMVDAEDALYLAVTLKKTAEQDVLRADRDYNTASQKLGSAQDALRALLQQRRVYPEANG